MKILALFLLLPSFSLAGLPTAEEEIATLKAEYARREAVAVRPVKDWLSAELAKKEKAFLAAGKSEAAAAVARERAVMLLCSTTWTWDAGPKGMFVLKLDQDGTASLEGPKKHSLHWSVDKWIVTLKMDDGRQAVLRFDPSALKYTGDNFTSGKVSGAPRS